MLETTRVALKACRVDLITIHTFEKLAFYYDLEYFKPYIIELRGRKVEQNGQYMVQILQFKHVIELIDQDL